MICGWGNRAGLLLTSSLCVSALAACGNGDASDSHEQGSGDGDAGQATGGGSALGSGGATASGGDALAMGGAAPAPSGSLSVEYPGDRGLSDDPAVLFFDDFEDGWGRWDAPDDDTTYLHLQDDPAVARGGSGYLRSTVTTAHLEQQQYISASPRVALPERVDEMWWRFSVQFPHVAPNPHHWVRVSAGTESWSSSGLANTVPPGDEGFWFDLDANNDDVFNFYVYFHAMRSGRCNDGSTTPGCEGDQGSSYHYGNVFRPPGQTGFSRGRWFCVEMHAKANTVGSTDGELSFWIDDELVGDYRRGHPEGTWLRDSFHTGGCDFSACTPPEPFEGFEFRTSSDVRFKEIFLDAYYERGTSDSKRAELESRGLDVSDEQTILYDDVVVATRRIGCVR